MVHNKQPTLLFLLNKQEKEVLCEWNNVTGHFISWKKNASIVNQGSIEYQWLWLENWKEDIIYNKDSDLMGEGTMLLTWESTAEFFPVMGHALVCSGAVSENLEPENKAVLQGSSRENIYWTMCPQKVMNHWQNHLRIQALGVERPCSSPTTGQLWAVWP